MKKDKLKMKLPSVDDLFSTEEERQEAKLPKLYEIPLVQIDDFPEHPYRVLDDEDMEALMESIKERGIITPALVRKKDDGRYEMISGHRRKRACERLELPAMKCEVVDVSRDEAIILMVDSNSQRSEIAPCDKGRAYKMKLEAIKRRQGERTDLTSDPLGQKSESKSSREIVAENADDSYTQIQRYIRLTHLIKELQDFVDEGKIKIGPYFREKKKTLGGVKAVDIQMFYVEEMKRRTQAMVIKEHVVIHSAFQHAVMLDLLDFSPMNKVQCPKKAKYIASYYNDEELAQLFEKTKTHKLGLLIQMTAFYGFRREEIIGLRWDAIDFERGTVSVRHTVTSTQLDGKKVIIQSDKAKTKSSLRTMPLVGQFKERLMALKEQQAVNKRVCGNCYDYKYDGYVFVDEMGKLFEPNWVTETFGRLLKKHGLRQIRFHDLRHSCASLMLANGVPMKQIQEWLGHSDIGTTVHINYPHTSDYLKVKAA